MLLGIDLAHSGLDLLLNFQLECALYILAGKLALLSAETGISCPRDGKRLG
jgi:hypothetical protein